MARADYQQAQQGLEQALGAMRQEWEQQLAEPSLPVRRRKIWESLREHWRIFVYPLTANFRDLLCR